MVCNPDRMLQRNITYCNFVAEYGNALLRLKILILFYNHSQELFGHDITEVLNRDYNICKVLCVEIL